MKLSVFLHFLYTHLVTHLDDHKMRQDIREGVVWYIMNNIEPNFTAMGQQFNCDYRIVKAAYLEAERRFEGPLPELK